MRVTLCVGVVSCLLLAVSLALWYLGGKYEEWYILPSRSVGQAALITVGIRGVAEGKTSLARWARRLLGSSRDE
jgi:hypothetical protein